MGSARTPTVLHTLEHRAQHLWLWKRRKCDPRGTACQSSVLSVNGCVASLLWYTMPCGLYLHLSPKDMIRCQKKSFYRVKRNIFWEMCCMQSTEYFNVSHPHEKSLTTMVCMSWCVWVILKCHYDALIQIFDSSFILYRHSHLNAAATIGDMERAQWSFLVILGI